MTNQLSFDWPVGVALGPDDFFVSQANAQAYAMMRSPDTWPDRKLVLLGPPGSGKSHLARIFAEQTGGMVIAAADITADFKADAATVIIEDMATLPAAAEETPSSATVRVSTVLQLKWFFFMFLACFGLAFRL